MEEQVVKETNGVRRGVKRQIFGCVLLSVGLLNSMLTLKGGLGVEPYNFVLAGLGAVLLASGIWAR